MYEQRSYENVEEVQKTEDLRPSVVLLNGSSYLQSSTEKNGFDFEKARERLSEKIPALRKI